MSVIYRGDLHRMRNGTIEYMAKLGWGRWEWKPLKGFTARKVKRILERRASGQGVPETQKGPATREGSGSKSREETPKRAAP